jgi:hypothetical protein
VLNKSIHGDVVNYARAVSHGVTELRTATKYTANSMANFNRAVYHEGWQPALENLLSGLERFASDYNSSAGFMQQQRHSTGLRAFSGEVSESVYAGRDRLAAMGLILSDEGQMAFDRVRLEGMNHAQVNDAIGQVRPVFEGLRAHTSQLMTEPLIEHMRFSGLSYHYNYRLGTMETEGYSLLEAGMLVDRLV